MSTFIFFSPLAFEKWDYRNPEEKGIGGSETAHIELALRLAKKGHEVISYSPLPKDIPNREFGGVSWRDVKELDRVQKGIWVISRYPKFVDYFEKMKFYDQRFWLVMQDEYYPSLTKKRAEIFDLIFPLCSDHVRLVKERYPFIPEEKIVQSSNGLRPEWVKKTLNKYIKRNPKRIMYASSPDRGLKACLQIFRKAVEWDPELEFHFYYGLNNISKFVRSESEHLSNGETIKELKELANHPRIFDHGRIKQQELYDEWAKSGIWLYATNFFETSCITSMESQALGAIPITAPKGALSDNVGFGIMVPGDVFHSKITQARYVYWLVRLANSLEEQNKIRGQMMQYALDRFSWDNIVNQYEELANG